MMVKTIKEIIKEAKKAGNVISEEALGEKLINYEQKYNTQLSHTRTTDDVYYESDKESIFNDYFGLNGAKTLSTNEIISKYNLNMDVSTLYSLIQQMLSCAIAENRISPEDVQKIKHDRYTNKKNQELDKLKYVFCSYYGLDGHENKRKFQLAQEFGVSPSTIEGWITKYRKILTNNQQEVSTQQDFS